MMMRPHLALPTWAGKWSDREDERSAQRVQREGEGQGRTGEDSNQVARGQVLRPVEGNKWL